MYSGKKQELEGHITISRSMGGDPLREEKPVHIELVDRLSGLTIIRANLSLVALSEAILGFGHVDCDLEYWGDENIGKKKVSKTENIPLPEGGFLYTELEAEVEKLVAPYEVDGWRGRRSDVTNLHSRNWDDNTVSVQFFRYEEIDD